MVVLDILIISYWWFILFVLGLAFLPITYKIFSGFYDSGYAFSKIIAIGIISYTVWIFGSLEIVPFSKINTWIFMFAFVIVNLYLTKNCIKSFVSKFNECRWIFIAEESFFFIILALWSLVRGFEPKIEGLEKFMDFGFINSILMSNYFPPLDIWLSGYSINYYYFGHLVAAVLTKISGISQYITYNLMIATIFALVFTSTFSLASNLVYKKIRIDENSNKNSNKFSSTELKSFAKKWFLPLAGGAISAIILALAGNLQHIYYFITNNYSFSGYWYPDATRFIPHTIHEFPIYSFVVADLHGFFSNLPFVILVISLIFILFKNGFKINIHKKSSFFLPIFLGLFLGIMYATNSIDFVIYAIVSISTILYSNYRSYGISHKFFSSSFLSLLLIIGSSVVFVSPFIFNFDPFVNEIDFVKSRSEITQLFVLWGFYMFVALSFFVFVLFSKTKNKNLRNDKKNREANSINIFVLFLFIFSASLVIFPEIFYIKDIYTEYPRANTMFKLVYQTWIMSAICVGYVVVVFIKFIRRKLLKICWITLFSSLFIIIMIYPYFAINSNYGELKTYKGLTSEGGIGWLRTMYPDDYKALKWMKKNIKNQVVIVEAAGEDYTHYGRISANTGFVNIVNWPSHEWLWRGSYDEAGKRQSEVSVIYESKNIDEVKKLLKKFKASYVFIGNLERAKYQNLNEENFKILGKEVFSSGNTRIYQITEK